MRRLSFSTTLLIAFLLLAALLGAAALRGLLALEDFAVQSRQSADTAVAVSADLQQLAERSVDLERSARQYLVLREAALKQRFGALVEASLPALDRLQAIDPDAFSVPAAAWREAVSAAGQKLEARDVAAHREALQHLTRLASLNEALADTGRQWIDRQNARLLGELEDNRRSLLLQVLASTAGALVIGIVIGWWLIRPVARMESAIDQLGESRFDEAIEIHGPADLQRLGRRLDWLRLRLAELEADRARVLRHVSHELKTPLAALREGVALIEEQVLGPLTGDQKEVVGILDQNARALQRQIEDLLGYNATVFDARRVRRSQVALAGLLQSVVDEQRLQQQARQVQVRLVAEPLSLLLDAEKLRVVFGNLLSNAIAYSPPGGEVSVTAAGAQGRLCIDVVDQGPGVAEGDRARIFEPFYRGSRRPAGAREGSGVGLSIVRELVAAQGGQVELRSAAAGAHFRVELPYEA